MLTMVFLYRVQHSKHHVMMRYRRDVPNALFFPPPYVGKKLQLFDIQCRGTSIVILSAGPIYFEISRQFRNGLILDVVLIIASQTFLENQSGHTPEDECLSRT